MLLMGENLFFNLTRIFVLFIIIGNYLKKIIDPILFYLLKLIIYNKTN